MTDASHRGINDADPRNSGIIEHFRPPNVTLDYVRARFARASPRETAEKIEARATKFMAELATKRLRDPPPLSQPLDQVADPHYGLSTHPDLVSLLWRLDSALPQSCRWVLWGYPALVHPETGVIFAVGFGTIGIVMRLPPDARERASANRTTNPGQTYDISDAGPEWHFLDHVAQSRSCLAAYDYAAVPQA